MARIPHQEILRNIPEKRNSPTRHTNIMNHQSETSAPMKCLGRQLYTSRTTGLSLAFAGF
eukprot:scaffold208352_cov18-Prasinocladus_malaysianus.AAC.1